MKRSSLPAQVILMAFVFLELGCAKLMGNLRRDLDDSDPPSYPTVGGLWSERGFLNESMPEGGVYSERMGALGHTERGPASMNFKGSRDGRTWVTPERAEANRRDRYRDQEVDPEEEEGVSFSNTPRLDPPTLRLYKNGVRATRQDFVDDLPNEGSLWGSDGQTNYYFTKNKVRTAGDIITVNLEENLIRDVSQEVRRTLSPNEKKMELALAQDRLKNKFLGIPDSNDKKNSSNPVIEAPAGGDKQKTTEGGNQPSPPEIPVVSLADIDVGKSLEIKGGDTMMAEIVERYPNGNYKVRGTKKIPYKNGTPRLVTLLGVVKSSDINEEDVVASGKLYEYRLEAIR